MRLTNLLLERDSLSSQLTRNFLGERTFDDLASNFLPNGGSGQGGGLLGFVLNAGKKFVGFLIGGLISFAEWSIGGIIRYAIEKTIEISSFDWAQSDIDLAKSIEQNNGVIANLIGKFIGSGAVWIASIAISRSLSVSFPVIAGRVALDLAREGGQTLKGQLFGTLGVTGELLLESLAMGAYAGSRAALRKAFPNNPLFSGNGSKKPWTFGEAINNTVTKVPGGNYVKQFVAGFADGFFDSLLDVAYTISFSLDDHYAAIREAQSNNQAPSRIIEVFPDETSEESIIITDNQDNIEQTLTSYLSNHQVISNRDVGVVVGQPYDEWYTLQPQSRKLCIEFRSIEKPPFKTADNELAKRVQISIPNAKPSIDWDDLKRITRFTWGNYMARGIFEDRRQMTVWGSSESEAKNTLIAAAELSTKNLIQISVSHPEVQNVARKKSPTVVYPCYATMLVRKPTVGATDYTLIDGQNRTMARTRVEIWRDVKPSTFTGFN